MKFRSLFVALAAMLILPALALAEPPAGKGSDKGSAASVSITLLDSDSPPKAFGKVIDVERGDADSVFWVTTVLDLIDGTGSPIQVALKVSQDSVQLFDTGPFFDNPDCQGPPWIAGNTRYRGWTPSLRPYTVTLTSAGQATLWVATSDVMVLLSNPDGISALHIDQRCITHTYGNPYVFPAEVLVDDLHLVYPPPYQLVIQ